MKKYIKKALQEYMQLSKLIYRLISSKDSKNKQFTKKLNESLKANQRSKFWNKLLREETIYLLFKSTNLIDYTH